MGKTLGAHAIVIGAGMAGLSAARVLADSFDAVTVIERDSLTDGPAQRAGVPQGHHVHTLLGGGQRALEELFPGFEAELRAGGAVPFRVGLNIRMERPGFGAYPQRDLGWDGFSMTRPLIEYTARRALRRHKNVTVRDGTLVQEVTTTTGAVSGVRVKQPDGKDVLLGADLVVDASGRGTFTLNVLEELGMPLPAESSVSIDMGYSTALFKIPTVRPNEWTGLMTFPQAPTDARGAMLTPVEGNRWIVTIAGLHGGRPPGDAEGFLAFTKALWTSTMYDAIKGAEPIGEIVRYAFPASVWRHFERLSALPKGLVPFGDVLCRANPIYGTGMTVAVLEALTLQKTLAAAGAHDDPLAHVGLPFLKAAPAVLDTPWSLVTLDLIYPETKGERGPDLMPKLQFVGGLLRLAAVDPAVHRLMFEVQHMIKPRSVYADPELQGRVRDVLAKAGAG